MTKRKKSPKQQQPTEDIPMADKDIMIITGVKVKYSSPKENEGIIISLMFLILHLYNN